MGEINNFNNDKKMIYEVIENGHKIYVEVSHDPIQHRDWYLALGTQPSIELCDSKELARWVNQQKRMYRKIIKTNQELEDIWCYSNKDSYQIDPDLNKINM
jgi:hypothetical protein